MNKDQLNNAWKSSSHNERNEFINDFSVGSIDNSDTTSIELFKVENEILAMDHVDINEPHPFLTIDELAHFYEWDNNELLTEIEETKAGITKDVLIKLLFFNLDFTTIKKLL